MPTTDTLVFGPLTLENIDRVAEQLLELLTGKQFTVVASSELNQFRPEVMINQRLNCEGSVTPIHVQRDSRNEYFARLVISAHEQIWMCETRTFDEEYSFSFKNPHFTFQKNMLIITHRVDAGYLTHWVILAEG